MNSSHRESMLKSLACSIIEYDTIKTTLPKAKEIRGYLEPLVTLAKVNNMSNQRLAYKRLQNREAVARLFNELGPRYQERPGGYLRIIKMGYRSGDKAPLAQIGFVKEKDVVLDEVDD